MSYLSDNGHLARAIWQEMKPLEGRARVAFVTHSLGAVLGIVTSLLDTDEPYRQERFHWEARIVSGPRVEGFANTIEDARACVEYAFAVSEVA